MATLPLTWSDPVATIPEVICDLCRVRPATTEAAYCQQCQLLAAVVAVAWYDSMPRSCRNWGWMKGRQAAIRHLADLTGWGGWPHQDP